MQVVDAHSMLCNLYIACVSIKNFSIHLLSGQFLDGNCARRSTEVDECGQYLWVCPVGVAMVPDGNPKKLEPMLFCVPNFTDCKSIMSLSIGCDPPICFGMKESYVFIRGVLHEISMDAEETTASGVSRAE